MSAESSRRNSSTVQKSTGTSGACWERPQPIWSYSTHARPRRVREVGDGLEVIVPDTGTTVQDHKRRRTTRARGAWNAGFWASRPAAGYLLRHPSGRSRRIFVAPIHSYDTAGTAEVWTGRR